LPLRPRARRRRADGAPAPADPPSERSTAASWRAALDLVGKVSDGPSYGDRVAEIVLMINGQTVRNPWPDLASIQEVAERVRHCIDAPRIGGQICVLQGAASYLVVNWNTVQSVQVSAG
jgi:hypothetical protein